MTMNHPVPRRRIRVEVATSTILAVVLTGIGLWIVGQLTAIIVTVIGSFILVGTFNPVVRILEDRGLKRSWALTLVFVVAGGALALILGVTVPAIVEQVSTFLSHLPRYQSVLADVLRSHQISKPIATSVMGFKLEKAASAVDVTATATASLIFIETVGYAVTAVVLAIYFIADHEKTKGGLFALVPRAYHVRLARILLNLEPIVGGYMRGQFLTSLAIGIFSFALLAICHVPNALALAAFASLTDVLPFVGAILATTPATLSALSQGPAIAAVVFFWFVAYQEFESRVIVPRVDGKALRLPSAVVILALLIGGKLGGIMGALLSLPLAATVRMVIEELRVELPGDDSDNPRERERDERAERVYSRESAGSSPVEAGSVASEIAEKQLKAEATED